METDRRQITLQVDQTFAEREEHVRTAEFLLNEHAEELERERAAFLADQKAWEDQKTRQRQAIDELRTATEAELADRRLRLDARQDWIERQKVGLEQVRDEALACIASRWKCGSLPNKFGRKSMAPSARHRRHRPSPNCDLNWLTNIASKKSNSLRGEKSLSSLAIGLPSSIAS